MVSVPRIQATHTSRRSSQLGSIRQPHLGRTLYVRVSLWPVGDSSSVVRSGCGGSAVAWLAVFETREVPP